MPHSFEPKTTSARRVRLEALGVGTLVAVALALFRLPTEILAPGAFRDDGVYIALGRAIATGHGYHSIYMPGAPLQVKYPPGLPFIYAGLWKLFGTASSVFVAASNLSLFVTALAAGLLWYVARGRFRLSPILALPFVVAPFFLEPAIQYYTLPITESFFVLAWGLVLVLSHRDETNRSPLRDAMVLGVVLGVAMLIRTQSITLVAAVVLGFLIARRWRDALIAGVIGIAPTVLWQVSLRTMRANGARISSIPDEAGYMAFLPRGSIGHVVTALATTAWTNMRFYLFAFSDQLSLVRGLGMVVCLLVLAAAAVTAWRMRRDAPVVPLSIAAALALTLLWPWSQDRLMVPALPFIGLLAAIALQAVAAHMSRQVRTSGVALLAALVVGEAYQQTEIRSTGLQATFVGGQLKAFTPSLFLPRTSRAIYMESLWLSKHTRPDDRLIAAAPAGIYLMADRVAEASTPAESRVVASVFAVPGHYLARAIIEDSVSVAVLENHDKLSTDAETLSRVCPNAFRLEGSGPDGWPAFLRVVDRDCIAREFSTASKGAN